MIASAVFSLLSADTGLIPLIASRVYPSYDRQVDRVYPLLVYKIENVSTPTTNDNSVKGQTADIVIAAIAATYTAAASLGQAVIGALEGQKGTFAGTKVQGIFLKDDGVDDEVVTDPTTEEILYYVQQLTFQSAYET